MPANAVKTPEDEQHWEAAKQQAEAEGKSKDWAYIMSIYLHMSHGEEKHDDYGHRTVASRGQGGHGKK